MGADGGTIPKRCELVRNKKKKERIDRNVEAAIKWKTCQLTQDALKKPIVACKFGRLYNKEAILEAKLSKTLSQNEKTKHIKSLSDVKELKLTENKAYKGDGPENADTYVDHNETPYICPITSLSMNGTNIFFVNWNCGCVISEKAIKEVVCNTCHGCGGPFDPEQLIQLYPSEELLKVYQDRIIKERALKKNKLNGNEGDENSAQIKKKNKISNGKLSSSSSSLTAKIKIGDKRKVDDSIQNNPNVSVAFKSIFTTSESAKHQKKAHWVTHNPLFY